MPDLLPTEECKWFVRYYETGNPNPWGHDNPEYRFDIYRPHTSASSDKLMFRMKGYADGEDYTLTDKVEDAHIEAYAIGYGGRHDVEFHGKLYVSKYTHKDNQALFQRLLDVMWEMCPKVSCRNCKSQHLQICHDPEDPTIDPDGAQGTECSTFFSKKHLCFGAHYGSDFDMTVFEATCLGMAAFGILQSPGRIPEGPYCDECVKRWVTDGLLIAYEGEWEPSKHAKAMHLAGMTTIREIPEDYL